MPASKRFGTWMVILAAACAVFAGTAQGATVALTPDHEVPMPYSFSSWGGYTLDPADQTYWVVTKTGANSGSVVHLSADGNSILASFSISISAFYPTSIGYYGGRVYIASIAGSSQRELLSFTTINGATNPGLASSDADTDSRLGSTQMSIRVGLNAVVTTALGQYNKVATLDGSNVAATHPFYPQIFMGTGINDNPATPSSPFQGCAPNIPGTCGTYGGVAGPGLGQLSYPTDVAGGPGFLFVTEGNGNRITHINTVSGGPVPDYAFGGPGTGAGQLAWPASIVRQASTGNLFIAERDNRRISVFGDGGGFIGAFGYGVLDGADKFEACGVGIGNCQAGIAYQSDPRSYFDRVDLGNDGKLYVSEPLVNKVLVLSGVGGPSDSPGGGTPSNAFTIGKLKGKTLSINVQAPGTVKVADAADKSAQSARKKKKRKKKPLGLKRSSASGGPGTITVKLKLGSAVAKKLKRTGKAKVKARITFTPTGGSAKSQTATLKLKGKKPKRKKT